MTELHLDGDAAKIDPARRAANNALLKKFGLGVGMPQYLVVDPAKESLLSTWGWENASVEKWLPLLADGYKGYAASK